MDTKEKRFFESLIVVDSAGWTVRLEPHMQPGSMDLATYSARLYVVDSSTGWTGAGAMQPVGFADAAERARAAGFTIDQMAESVGAMISKLGREQVRAGDPQIGDCLQLMAAALTGTQTFEIAKGRGLDGHFMYVGYRMLDGSTISRPMFFSGGPAGFVGPDTITDMVRRVVVQDHKTPDSTVGRMLKKSGGALLAEIYI